MTNGELSDDDLLRQGRVRPDVFAALYERHAPSVHRIPAVAGGAGARRDELRVVLTDLTEGERELLLLVAWEDLTPAEAGFALGLTPVAARSRLFRARTRARTSLAAHQPVGPSKECRS